MSSRGFQRFLGGLWAAAAAGTESLMYKYACPKCRVTTCAPAVRDGEITPCPVCDQPLRIVLRDERKGKRMPEPARRPALARPPVLAPPLLVIASGIVGLLGAAIIVAVWALFGSGPGQTPPDKQLARIELPDLAAAPTPRPAPVKADPVATSQDPAPTEPEPKRSDLSPPPRRPEPAPSRDPERPPVDPAPIPVPDEPRNTEPQKPEVKEPGDLPIRPTALSDEAVYQRVLKSCVWIVATDGTKVKTPDGKIAEKLATGSGSIVDVGERLVVTNEHVVNPARTKILVILPMVHDGQLVTENAAYWKEVSKGGAIPAKLVRYDRRRDLSLIQLEKLPVDAQALRVASRSPISGQKVHTVGGCPEGNQGQWIYSNGAVRQVMTQKWKYEDGFEHSAKAIASQVPINRGDSGGGLVDGRGVLVGVNNAGTAGQLNSMHIDATEVRDFIQAYFREAKKEWKEPPEPAQDLAVGDDVPRLIKALAGRDATVRAGAAAALADLGPGARQAIPALVKALKDEDAAVRRHGAAALGRIGPGARDDAAAVLFVLLRDADRGVRQAAQAALPLLGKPAVEPVTLKALLADRSAPGEARAYAVLALAEAAGTEALPTLLDEASGESDPLVAAAAVKALGLMKVRTREVSQALGKALDHNDKPVRVQAAAAIRAGRGRPDSSRFLEGAGQPRGGRAPRCAGRPDQYQRLRPECPGPQFDEHQCGRAQGGPGESRAGCAPVRGLRPGRARGQRVECCPGFARRSRPGKDPRPRPEPQGTAGNPGGTRRHRASGAGGPPGRLRRVPG